MAEAHERDTGREEDNRRRGSHTKTDHCSERAFLSLSLSAAWLEGQAKGSISMGAHRNLRRRRMAWLVSLVSLVSSKSHINPSSLAPMSSCSFSVVYHLLCTSLTSDVSVLAAHRRCCENPCDRPKERGRSVTVQAGIFTQSPFRTIDHDISAHNHPINTKLTFI
jgi:hypothetical protein